MLLHWRLAFSLARREEEDTITVKIIPNDKGNPPGTLVDAELHFTDGPLEGLKLISLAVWERPGGSRNVTLQVDRGRRLSAQIQPRSFIARPACQIFCICLILSPSKYITYT